MRSARNPYLALILVTLFCLAFLTFNLVFFNIVKFNGETPTLIKTTQLKFKPTLHSHPFKANESTFFNGNRETKPPTVLPTRINHNQNFLSRKANFHGDWRLALWLRIRGVSKTHTHAFLEPSFTREESYSVQAECPATHCHSATNKSTI